VRVLSSGAQALLATKTAIDTAFIISIQWTIGGAETLYVDRATEDMEGVLPRIVAIGEIDETRSGDSAGTTSAMSLTLSDTDGVLKNLFDTQDIHKRLVKVYQYFVGTSVGDKFLLFTGQLSTPIVWNEGARTLSFEVVTKLEDLEVGFSAEMGRYQSIAPSLIGQPWPMVFGTVQHVPGMQLQEIPTAFTTEPFAVVDQSLVAELNKISLQVANFPKVNVAKICGRDLVWTESDCAQEDANDQAFQEGTALQAQLDGLITQQRDLESQLNQQRLWERSRVNLAATTQVTQPFTGTFRVGSSLFTGHLDNTGGYINTGTPLLEPGNYNLQAQLIKAGYQFVNAGTQVVLASAYPVKFVVSLTPGAVLHVYAFQSFRGLRRLVKVPPSYYTVSVEDYGPGAAAATIVTVHQPLSTVSFLYNLGIQNWENNFGQYLPPHLVASVDWEDAIYVTFASTVGPNPVEIMIYIIDNYTQNSYDVDNFAEVAEKVAVTPMNFLYQSLDNAFSLLQGLAYQARCAIYLVEDVFHLRFLPEAGEEVDSISESDTVLNSLQVTTTTTEELITVYEATFKPDYSPTFDTPIRAIFRFNIARYGYHKDTFDFYAFNSFDVVEKVATFWMIRKSMTWKLLKCQLQLNKIAIEVFDTVLLDFAHPYVASAPVKAMVISSRYNPEDQKIDVEFWVPVRLGEMVPYTASWDDGINEIEIFPTYRDIQAGSAGGVSGGTKRALPASNGLILDIQLNQRNNFTQGDPTPLGSYSVNDDGEAVIPGDLSYLAPLPGGDPGLDGYHYPEPETERSEPHREWSAAYPGTLVGYQSTLENGRQVYNVDIYRNGVTKPAVTTACQCMQLDIRDRIPPGVACVVMENVYRQKDESTGNDSFVVERTFVIPIWLR
jgi:hypothetical protein